MMMMMMNPCVTKKIVHRARQFYIANMHGAWPGGLTPSIPTFFFKMSTLLIRLKGKRYCIRFFREFYNNFVTFPMFCPDFFGHKAPLHELLNHRYLSYL